MLKDYYVVFAEPRTRRDDKSLPHLDEKHKRIFDGIWQNQLRLEESGQLFAAGPLLDEKGKRIGGLIHRAPLRSKRRGRLSIRIRTDHQGYGTTPFAAGG